MKSDEYVGSFLKDNLIYIWYSIINKGYQQRKGGMKMESTAQKEKQVSDKMRKKEIEYIDFDEFVNNSGVKKSTIKRKYKCIPGLSKTEKGFMVVSGTRYPYNLRNTKLEDYSSRRYTLLKAISMYKYISHKELKMEHRQFETMLRELLSAGLIQSNNLSNTYGANAYDCTALGGELISRTDKDAKDELVKRIASMAGTFTGAVLSQIYDVA